MQPDYAPEMTEIGLAETIEALRSELATAMKKANGQDIQFPLGRIELEFHVGVRRATDAKAGVKFWVVELGGSGAYSAESIQKVSITLEPPVDATGTPLRVARTTGYKP